MLSSPSAANLLDAVVSSLRRDVMPELQTDQARAAVAMMQGLLQVVRQRVAVEQQIMAAESNEMSLLLRQLPDLVADSADPAAERLRERASSLGRRPDFAAIPAFDEVVGAYESLTESIEETVEDLDALIRAGQPGARAGLEFIRAYLARRSAIDATVFVAGAGLVGRG